MDNADPTRRLEADARTAAWTQGSLRWWLRPGQKRLYDVVRSHWAEGRFTLVCHRRFGKSAICSLVACEQSLRFPGSRVLYFAPTAEQGAEIAQDQFRALLDSCPRALQPRWVVTRNSWEFPNGSVVRYYGGEKRARRRIRGLRGEIAILDEARDLDAFSDLLSSVVGPALQYARGGAFTLIASTPPDDEEHEFFTFAREALDHNAGALVTIDDNPDVDATFRDQAVRDCGGKETEAYDREYRCQFVTAASRLVLPGFPETCVARREDSLGESWTALDPGGNDLTAILHGTHGPEGLYVSGEWAKAEVTLDDIATAVSALEQGAGRVGRRWTDQIAGGDILRRSLASLPSRLVFEPVGYGDPRGAVSILRTALDRGLVVISSDCQLLLRTLRLAQWEPSIRPSFRRMPRSGIGHADLLAALLIAVCNSVHVRRAMGTSDMLSLRKKRREAFRSAYGII